MTDRIKGFTVVLRPEVREEHAEEIKNAILLFRDVIDVKYHVEDPNHYFAYIQAACEIRAKIYRALEPQL